MRATRIALVGLGKIARDQHVPALQHSAQFEVIATASPEDGLPDLPHYHDLDALLRAHPETEAVAICTPPQPRVAIARRALGHGCHVLLEKPPAVRVSDAQSLAELAASRGVAVFTAWHSQEAAGVEPARAWLVQHPAREVRVQWKEDVRVWHPGQTWIWQPDGLGVFDPGINALSILTRILPGELRVQEAELQFPANCATPIAARLWLTSQSVSVSAEFDFLHAGEAVWNIDVDTQGGQLRLGKGGSELRIDGNPIVRGDDREYPRLYDRFAQLLAQRRVQVDLAPLRLVSDALQIGRRVSVAPFVE